MKALFCKASAPFVQKKKLKKLKKKKGFSAVFAAPWLMSPAAHDLDSDIEGPPPHKVRKKKKNGAPPDALM
jgi:hypothetical protein